MALIADKTRFVKPQVYFFSSYGQIPELKLESGTVSSQVKNHSRVDAPQKVVKFLPDQNKVVLANGKEYTYKALILAPGFHHKTENIKGLKEFEKDRGENNVFVHAIDDKHRLERNYYHGSNHFYGDMINYSPKFPYKGEGCDFYSFYYEHINRYDKLQGRSAKSSRIQYWTPNKKIFNFDYANEWTLDQCEKRGIDVNFGWEMIEVKTSSVQEKIAVFKNVDTGEIIERPFFTMAVNPESHPHKELIDGGLTNDIGLVDVNPHTLQHKKYENVFAFGDCIAGETTRTQYAAANQTPIIKHNVKQFLYGKELNAIYDGYTYFPLMLGQQQATGFSHYWNYEPHPLNHIIPAYGIFSRLYFSNLMRDAASNSDKYSGFKANVGPPYWKFNPTPYPLELNEYLIKQNVSFDSVRQFEPKNRLEAHHDDHHGSIGEGPMGAGKPTSH